mmetsp:Transcript_49565/g.81557  ORF Transcript_49565/g.81557 Transcript_49565/m.81557 type:complete len:80 (+) Transcript_49565:11-250(+)
MAWLPATIGFKASGQCALLTRLFEPHLKQPEPMGVPNGVLCYLREHCMQPHKSLPLLVSNVFWQRQAAADGHKKRFVDT